MSVKPSEGPQTSTAIRLNNLLSMLPEDNPTYGRWLIENRAVFLSEEPTSNAMVAHHVLIAINELINAYEHEVKLSEMLPAQQDLLLGVLEPLRNFFSPISLGERMGVFDIRSRVGLEYGQAFMKTSPSLSQEDLADILLAISQVEGLLKQADISSVLRSTLQELIRLAKDAITRFQIYGADGLRKQFRSMVGETALLLQELHGTQLKKPDEVIALKLMKRLVNTVGNGLKKVGAYKDGTDLMGGIVKLLGGGDGGD